MAIVLFGFGTYANKVAKFNLPGPDMAPEDFAPLLAKLKSKRIVFVDTTSASAPFVEALSGPGRVIVTATRTGGEVYATLFGGPFVEAFSTRGGRRRSRRQGLDPRGVRLRAQERWPRPTSAKGCCRPSTRCSTTTATRKGRSSRRATRRTAQRQRCSASARCTQQALPADEKLRALYLERQDLERRIDALKLLKSGMDPEKYAAELEKLATELALKTRQIREAEGKGK